IEAEIAAVNPDPIIAPFGRFAVDEKAVPTERKVDAERDRQRQRAPGPRIDLQENPAAGGEIAPELEHRHAGESEMTGNLGARTQQFRIERRADAIRGSAAARAFMNTVMLKRKRDIAAISKN